MKDSDKLIKNAVSSFFCEINPDIEDFIKIKAVMFEKRKKSRTYLIVDEDKLVGDKEISIIAYYTIALKNFYLPGNLSKTKRKKIDGFNKNTTETVTYLIGQLGRNDEYSKEIIYGEELLNYAIESIMDCQDIVGGRVILVECEDIEKLIKFYESNYFELIEMGEESDTFTDDIISLLPSGIDEGIITTIREVVA